jgi:hypothetical protein
MQKTVACVAAPTRKLGQLAFACFLAFLILNVLLHITDMQSAS